MSKRPFLSLILPAYNEVSTIAQTLAEAVSYFESRGLTYEVIVSADGEDGTRELTCGLASKNPCIRVIGSPERRGKGRGIRDAVQIAQGQVVGFVDADNKTPISEFDKFLDPLTARFDVVIGSRALAGSVIERPQAIYRRVGSKGFALFMHLTVGLRGISDTQCGFKFFRQSVAKDLFSRQRIDGYMFDVEVLYLAEQAGYCIAQIPVRWRDDGDSRLMLVRGNIRNFLDILSIRLGSRHAVRADSDAPVPAMING